MATAPQLQPFTTPLLCYVLQAELGFISMALQAAQKVLDE
jgi:hypothetical protein